jgi:oligoendopeptidase F
MRVLSLGGSKSPVELLAIMGMDIQQPDFWDQGLKLLDDMQKNAERLANKITF